jgi:hypothetical protein
MNYPPVVLDTGKVLNQASSCVRKKYKKTMRACPEARTESLSKLTLPQLEPMVRAWANDFAHRIGGDADGLFDEYMDLFVKAQKCSDTVHGFGVVQKDELLALQIWDESLAPMAVGVANIYLPRIPGISEYSYISACKILHERGLTQFDLGCSETAGLHEYKTKFMPRSRKNLPIKTSPKLTHLPAGVGGADQLMQAGGIDLRVAFGGR